MQAAAPSFSPFFTMDKRIVILTTPGDLQAFAVTEGLRCRGTDPLIWFPADFPTKASETISIVGDQVELKVRSSKEQIQTLQADTVWYRRIGSNPDTSAVHPADRVFALAQRQGFRDGSLLALFSDAFWINPPATARIADNKLFQHSVASRLGLMMPDSLYTNDPSEIRNFLRAHGGRAVYKVFPAAAWKSGDDLFVCHTMCISEEDLVADELLAATPGIYQAVMPKAYEIRLTMMGAHPFAVKILSQDTEKGRLDWRRSYDELKMEPTTLPAGLVESCRLLMKKLNLVFGCFDFIVDPDGNYVFLEVNQQGQFLFLETYAEIPLLDAFCELLIQGPAFSWRGRGSGIRYEDVSGAAQKLAAAAALDHFDSPLPSVSEP